MKRLLVTLAALVCLEGAANATRYWTDTQNTTDGAGVSYCPDATMSASCAMVSQSDGEIVCVPSPGAHTFVGYDGTTISWNTVSASWITGWPTGVLEGSGGALSGFSATPNLVVLGAASGGGITQSPNLSFDGSALYLGAHTIAPWPTLRSLDVNSTATILISYPGSGTNVSNTLRVSPRGAGSGTTSGILIYNTDEIAGGANQEMMSMFGFGANGFVISSSQSGTGTLRPIAMGTDSSSAPKQCVLNTDGSVAFGTGNIKLNKASAYQGIFKSGGGNMYLSVDTADQLVMQTNGAIGEYIDASQKVTMPSLSGGGTQCVQVNNAGTLAATGAPCGSGGLGGASGSGSVTNVTATAPIFISGTPSVTPNVEVHGAITSGSTSTAAQNLGSLTAGLLKQSVSAGAATLAIASPVTDYQTPLTACTDYVSLSCVSGGDLGGSNATPRVVGIYDATNAIDYTIGLMTAGECLAIDSVANEVVTVPCSSGGSGTVTSVSGGTAISISGTPTVAPVVNAKVDATTVTVNGSNQLQRGALGGDVSASAGSNTVNVVAVESATSAKGYVDWTAMSAPANPAGTVTREYNSLFGAGLVSVDSAGTARYMERDVTCGSNTWASSNAGGTLACTQPSFSNLSGSIACAQLPALTTDLSSAGGTCAVTVVGVESNAAMRGVLVANQVATPPSPSAGFTKIYSDSNGTASAIDPSGNVSHTFRTTTCGSNTWASSFAGSGAISCTQPAFSNLSGSAACSQLPALTGGVTSTAGSCATTVASVSCSALPALTGGVTSTPGSCATTLDGASVAAATTKFTYSLQLQLGASTPNTWLLEGGPGLWSNGAVIEYPNNFKASRIQVVWYLRSNTVLTGTLSVFAAMNGSGIGGTGFSVTPSTSAGVHVGTNLPTGSTSSSDTYGLVFSTDSLFSSASPSAAFLTVEVMLMP